MSRLSRRLSTLFPWLLTHPRTRATRRFLAEGRRRISARPHLVHYFHQADDPYSHLAAQALEPLCARYDIELASHLVGPPPDEAAPERALLEAFARKDAADVAPYYGLAFPASAIRPVAPEVDRATERLAAAISGGDFPRDAVLIGAALWGDERRARDEVNGAHARAEADAARGAIAAGNALRRRLRHYLGAMFHYAGEWYWGVDRLWHLERRLRALGAQRDGAPAEPIVSRPDFRSQPPVRSARRLRLEFFPSLRSPYTAISMRRVQALRERLPIDLVVRPVLPMVMRGLPVPLAKRLYIVQDTKREAEDAGEPFGRLCDPVGRPVERGYSLYPWAREHGRGIELLASFTGAAFAEGVDTGSDAGLRFVVERAGLSWEEAQATLDGEGWRGELEDNRRTLVENGLWGVPSFRLIGEGGEPDFCTWGQDRIWRVEAEVRRRLGAATQGR